MSSLLPHALLQTSLNVNQLRKAVWRKIPMRSNEGDYFFIQLLLHLRITRQIIKKPQQSTGCLLKEKANVNFTRQNRSKWRIMTAAHV